jgi:hypothetical protein
MTVASHLAHERPLRPSAQRPDPCGIPGTVGLPVEIIVGVVRDLYAVGQALALCTEATPDGPTDQIDDAADRLDRIVRRLLSALSDHTRDPSPRADPTNLDALTDELRRAATRIAEFTGPATAAEPWTVDLLDAVHSAHRVLLALGQGPKETGLRVSRCAT